MLIVVAFWVKELVGRLDKSDLWDVDLDDDNGGVGGVVVANAYDDRVVATNACDVIAVWHHLKCTFLSWACWKAETRKKKEITK